MKGQWKFTLRAAAVLLATAALASASPNTMPSPGTVNYVEGQVSLDGQELTSQSSSTAVVAPNHVLETGQGKAEILLTPGVFLRVGDNSAVRMVSPGLADTSVQVVRGTAMLEAAELMKENHLSVDVGNYNVHIQKRGLYLVDADRGVVSVLDGEATVYGGDAHVTLKKGHETVLAADMPLKSQGFNKNAVEAEDLYRWSKLRGEYVAEANIDAAQTVMVNGGWYGPGWYWDPYWSFYSYLPGYGMLWSPWGWGLYSPGWVWSAPVYYRSPIYRSPYYHGWRPVPRVTHGFSNVGRTPVMSSPRMAPMGGGFRGGFGGGFHGGFHGGGGRR